MCLYNIYTYIYSANDVYSAHFCNDFVQHQCETFILYFRLGLTLSPPSAEKIAVFRILQHCCPISEALDLGWSYWFIWPRRCGLGQIRLVLSGREFTKCPINVITSYYLSIVFPLTVSTQQRGLVH